MVDTFQCKIVTPTSEAFSGEATYASFQETRFYGSARTHATAVAAQGTGLAGLNAPPYGVSEFKGYDHETASTIGSATDWVFETENVAQEVEDDEQAGPNTMFTGSGCEIYCSKSGSKNSQINSVYVCNSHPQILKWFSSF